MRDSYRDVCAALASIEVEDHGYKSVLDYVRMARETAGPHGARIFFIGNGGSAAIASHMAADWMKNGGFPTFCFNDGSLLTCISNDLGYDRSFRLPLQHHGRLGDILFAISSSGDSMNIVGAADLARQMHMNVVTLSGFRPDNRLRDFGGVNFYVPSRDYGVVEIAHLAILHSILDEVMEDIVPQRMPQSPGYEINAH